jgi:hypothetical protein
VPQCAEALLPPEGEDGEIKTHWAVRMAKQPLARVDFDYLVSGGATADDH